MTEIKINAKRILAFLLTVAMIFSGSTAQAFAQELLKNQESVIEEVELEDSESDAQTSEDADVMEEMEVSEESTTDAVTEESNAAESEINSVSSYNGQAVCSALNGAVSDTKLARAVLTTKKSKGATTSSVRITWKKPSGSSARRYRLDRISEDGTIVNLQDETGRKKSQRSYNDKRIPDDATYIYLVTYFDRYGARTSDAPVAAVASPTIMFAQTGENTDRVQMYIPIQNGPVNYIIERSDRKNKTADYQQIADLNVSALNGEEAYETVYNGIPAICFTDKTTEAFDGFKLNSSHYYRVKAYVSGLSEDSRVESVYSKGYKVKAVFGAPELLSITGDHADGSVCYKKGIFSFTKVVPPSGKITKYAILRSKYRDHGYSVIKTVKVSSLTEVSSLNGTGKAGYMANYNKMTPDKTYYYRVRAVGKSNITGAMSNPIENTCRFAKVSEVEVDSVSTKQLRVSWKYEKCATKYVIERSTALDTSALNGEEKYGKIATVNASKVDKGTGRIIYQDKKRLQDGKYYAYRIYPVNGSAKGTYAMSDPVTGHVIVGSPKPKVEGGSMSNIRVSWAAIYGATSYTIQRTTVTGLDGTPDFTNAVTVDEVKKGESEFKKRLITDKNLTPFVSYYYRILTHSASGDSDPAKARWTEGYTRPKAVKSIVSECTDIDSSGKHTNKWQGIRITIETSDEQAQVSKYRFYRSVDGGKTWKNCGEIAENGKTKRAVRDPISYVGGRKYQYRICAVASNGVREIEGVEKTARSIIVPKSLSLNSESKTMKVGEKYKIQVKDFDPSNTTFKDVKYSIADTNIVERSDDGNSDGKPYIEIKARKVGSTTVTLKPRFGGDGKKVTITVK